MSQIFDNTTATYKFYWFLGLLDILVKECKTKISFSEIIASMIAESWYPIHYFKISFGKSDSLFDYSQSIQKHLQIPIDADKTVIKAMILENIAEVKRYLNKLDDNVPYWLLTPWFEKTSKRDIVLKSQRFCILEFDRISAKTQSKCSKSSVKTCKTFATRVADKTAQILGHLHRICWQNQLHLHWQR
ncbi:MAG: hypothetical protein IJ894_03165, partial [Bacteroidales bacterium]|nr:hypothetical protein [Bacteroidales bacterium]